MQKTQVTIETFKQSGKWYDIIHFETNTPPHDTPKLIEECKSRAQSGMSFTFEAESATGGLNKRMVLIAEDKDYQIIQAKEGSLIITPERIAELKSAGLDLNTLINNLNYDPSQK